MSNRRYSRKQVYVNRNIQGRFVARLAAYWITYHLVLWHAMFLYRYVLYRGQLLADPTLSPLSFSELYVSFLSQYQSMLLCSMAVFPLILWDMIKLTHRVAGPLVRFKSTLEQLKRGEKVDPIQLRQGDLLFDLQDSFNGFLETANLLREDGRTRGDRPHGSSGDDDSDEVLAELKELRQSVVAEDAALSTSTTGESDAEVESPPSSR